MSPYMDGELTRAEAAAVTSHLSVCANCSHEYETLLRISVACRHLGDITVPAPSGFKNTVMQRMNNETKVVKPARYTNWLNYHWKQTAAGAAAAILLVLGALSINSAPLMQLADRIPVLYQSDDNTPVIGNPVNTDPSTPAAGTQAPSGIKGNSNSDSPAVVATNTPVVNAPVFLNNERYLSTTLVQVKVNDASVALEQALKLTAAVQAPTQNLGQQVNATGTYTVLKITVPKSAASDLIVQLGSLGTVTGQEVSKQDISTRFAETLSQYQLLITQRATLQDDSQKEALDQRITTLQNELQSWEQKAEQETIVLWIELGK